MDISYILTLIGGIYLGQEYKNIPNIKKTSTYFYDMYKEHIDKSN